MANTTYTAVTALETALAKIQTGSGYNYDLGNTPRVGAVSAESVKGDRPHVYINSFEETPVLFSSGNQRQRLAVTVRGMKPGTAERDAKGLAFKLKADIENAVYSDRSLGSTVDNIYQTAFRAVFHEETMSMVIELDFMMDIFITEGSA